MSNENIDSNANNGMLTKIWGRCGWPMVHSITFGYMIQFDPTNKDHVKRKEGIKSTFLTLAECWPCIYCRKSYEKFTTDPSSPAFISDEIFESRETLTRWGFRLHQCVNNKLGVDYGLEYEDIVPIYESFRAKCVKKDKGCTMPIDLKAKSYQMADIRHAPVVSMEFAQAFRKYVKARSADVTDPEMKLDDYDDMLIKYDRALREKNRKKRDEHCVKIIDTMRKNSVSCTENSGKYEGLPTYMELMLLSMRCSNISYHEHKNILVLLAMWETTLP